MPDELPILHTEQRGDGPPLLFLHGLADTSACWEAVIDELASDHRCVTADLPGHGRSPAPDDPTAYERDGVLGSIDAVLDRTGPAVAVGHSLGGYLALAHSITRPGVLRGLALVSTGPGFRDDASRERWNDRVLKGASGYSISETAATIGLHVDSLVIDRLHSIEVPVTLIVGGDDRGFLGATDYLEHKLGDVTRLTVAGGRHFVMRTHPTEVAGAIRALAERVARTTA